MSATDTERHLAERLKELNCLYGIAKATDRRDSDLAGVLSEIVRLIPRGWQHPEVAYARILLNDAVYESTPGARPCALQASPIIAHGAAVGRLEVGYVEPRPECDEGPFLTEERNLLNVIAQRIGEIAEKKWADQELVEHRQQLRSLAVQLVSAEARERRRLAQQLHDRIGQYLATIKIKLGIVGGLIAGGEAAGILADIRQLVSQTIDDTRTLIFHISPPLLYEFGLPAALEWLAEQSLRQHDLVVTYSGPETCQEMCDDVRAVLFQATGELLANVARHAGTRSARIFLAIDDREARIRVEDDGVGFDVDQARRQMMANGSFGLFSIAERLQPLGGRLHVDSRPGAGTRITLSVPAETFRPGDRTGDGMLE